MGAVAILRAFTALRGSSGIFYGGHRGAEFGSIINPSQQLEQLEPDAGRASTREA